MTGQVMLFSEESALRPGQAGATPSLPSSASAGIHPDGVAAGGLSDAGTALPERPPFAEVLVDLAVPTVDRIFHYQIPPDLPVELGQAVKVPFGRRQLPGLVVGFAQQAEVEQLRAIEAVLYHRSRLVTPEQLQLAAALAAYYLCPLSLMLRQMIPFRLTLDDSRWPRPKLQSVVVPLVDRLPDALSARAVRQRQLLTDLLERGELPLAAAGGSASVKQLEQKGWVRVVQVAIQRSPALAQVATSTQPLPLTADQQSVLDRLLAGYQAKQPGTWLLHGVTGSGKTEVYMQLIARVLAEGQQVLVLVPEIALTPQMVERFSARFGQQIAVWHSGLSPGQRFDEWQRVQRGEARVLIGARSAAFAPFSDLGLIVMDEEHDGSYRQDENPRYHTRVVAQLRQRLTGCQLLLGSATPALESYYASEIGKCNRLELPARISQSGLPPVRVVDMREELRAGHREPISRRLQHALALCLERQEQALVLLNRRGYANFLLCPDCGHVPFCPHCDISLTYHQSDHRLHCHYCGHTAAFPRQCPECGAGNWQSQGLGTEQLQDRLAALFPAARIGRMDADTTSHRDGHAQILGAFARGELDLLVGTQMIAKGLDFPRVTLVGVVAADAGLYVPDFRASERTFQLLTQVAGRAGRASHPGEVIFQTHRPDHYVLQAARNHDYQQFYQQELAMRQHAGYPPLGYLVTLLLTNREEPELIRDASSLHDCLQLALAGRAELIGPTPCGISRVRDSFRWQIIIRSRQRSQLRSGLSAALRQYQALGRRTGVLLDFDA